MDDDPRMVVDFDRAPFLVIWESPAGTRASSARTKAAG
jgi:hypothetical protein